MKLVFKRGYNWSVENPTTISMWNSIVILLTSGEEGEVDVMFTGVSKSGRNLFAKVITNDLIKVESNGFSTSGSLCTTSAEYINDKGKLEWFTPGLLNKYIYSSDNFNIKQGCIYIPSLKGTFYLTKHNNNLVACGTDDPSLFLLFTKYNKQYNEFKDTYGFKIGQRINISSNYGGIFSAIVTKVISYSHAIVMDDNSKEFSISLNSVYLGV